MPPSTVAPAAPGRACALKARARTPCPPTPPPNTLPRGVQPRRARASTQAVELQRAAWSRTRRRRQGGGPLRPRRRRAAAGAARAAPASRDHHRGAMRVSTARPGGADGNDRRGCCVPALGLQSFAIPGHDEQRIVHADAEPDQCGHDGRERGCGEHVAQQRDGATGWSRCPAGR